MDRLFPLEVQYGRGRFLQAGSLRGEVTIPRGVRIFLVAKGTPGLSVSRTFDKLGYKGIEAANLLGGHEGEGFKHAMNGLEVGRINVGA